MKIRNEQLEAMSRSLGVDFRPRLTGCLDRLTDTGKRNIDEVVQFCLTRGGDFQLASERELAVLAIALCSRGGFTGVLPVDLESLLRDLRNKPDERLASVLEWAEDTGDLTELADEFDDRPAAGPIVPVTEESSADWLTLELLDEADWPIAGEEYHVTLPNGATARGFLGADGRAVIAGFPPSGECRVTFPNLDQEVWERDS